MSASHFKPCWLYDVVFTVRPQLKNTNQTFETSVLH